MKNLVVTYKLIEGCRLGGDSFLVGSSIPNESFKMANIKTNDKVLFLFLTLYRLEHSSFHQVMRLFELTSGKKTLFVYKHCNLHFDHEGVTLKLVPN